MGGKSSLSFLWNQLTSEIWILVLFATLLKVGRTEELATTVLFFSNLVSALANPEKILNTSFRLETFVTCNILVHITVCKQKRSFSLVNIAKEMNASAKQYSINWEYVPKPKSAKLLASLPVWCDCPTTYYTC